MKLIELTIKNIASIEDATLLFEDGYLKNDSLFLICGPTGAGKSTILDAICLALFKKTPRLSSATQGSFYPDTNNEEQVTFGNCCQLLRRGTKEGFSKLKFESNDGDIYESRLTLKKKKNYSAEWTLTNITRNVNWSKSGEIEDEIEKSIGSNFENFCRTTLLAQGNFNRFLNCKDDERSIILQNLTGKNIFEQLGEKIYEITKEKENVKNKIECSKNELQILSEDEINQLKQEIIQLEENVKLNEAEHAAVEKKMTWKINHTKSEEELKKVQSLLTEKESELSTETYQKESDILNQWKLSMSALANYKDLQVVTEQFSREAAKETNFQTNFQNICAGWQTKCRMTDDKKRSLKEIEQQLVAFSDAQKSMFADEKVICEQLTQANNSHFSSEKTNVELQSTEKKLQEIDQQVRVCKKTYEVECQNTKLAQQKINELTSAINEIDPDGTLLSQKDDLNQLSYDVSLLVEKMNQLSESESQLKELENNCLQKQSLIPDLQEKELLAQTEYNNSDMKYRVAEQAVSDYVKELRNQLKEGDECPVCGRTIEHIYADEHFSSALKGPEEERKAKKLVWDSASRQLLTVQTEVQQIMKEQSLKKQNVCKMQSDYSSLMSQVKKQLITKVPDCSDEISPEKLTMIVKDKLSLIIEKCNSLTNLQKERYEAQSEKDLQEKREKESKDQLDELQKMYDQFTTEKSNKEILIQQFKDKEKEILLSLGKTITLPNWIEHYQTNCENLKEKIHTEAQLFVDLENKKMKLSHDIDMDNKDWEHAEKTIQSIRQEGRWTIINDDSVEVPQLVDKTNQFATEYASWKTILSDHYRRKEKLKDELSNFYAKTPSVTEETLQLLITNYTQEKIDEIDKRHETLDKDIVSLKGQVHQIIHQIAEQQDNRPNFTEIENSYSLADFESKGAELMSQVNGYHQQIGARNNQLKENETKLQRLQTLMQDYEKAVQEYYRWDGLNQAFGSADGKKFRTIALSFVLDVLLKYANVYLQKFDDNFELIKCNELTIVVKDYRNNGVLASGALSGGQQFMVSLALALGLSDMSYNSRCSSNTLFIDEGFGTLSDDYLTNVMDCLENLHQQTGKKIGIISHVERLRERIHTQIVVEGGKGSKPSTISVIGDY